jgi:hypothetical protein
MACTMLPSFTLQSARKVAVTATHAAMIAFNFESCPFSMASPAASAMSLMGR